MNFKKYLYSSLAIVGVLSLHACLSTTTPTYSNDGHIIRFSLQNNNVPALAKTVFTIDETRGIIYNVDSLPFNTDVKHAIPVITAFSTARMYLNDSVYTGKDTVDFSRPVILKNYAQDGITIRQYIVTVNVHKVNPDSINWQQRTYPSITYQPIDQKAVFFNQQLMLYVNDGSQMHLYTSVDGKNWNTQFINTLPVTVNLRQIVSYNNTLCVVENGQTLLQSTDGITWNPVSVISSAPLVTLIGSIGQELIGIQQNNGFYSLCYSNDAKTWNTGEALTNGMANFPISHFSAISYQPIVGSPKLLVVGGINAAGQIVNSIFSYMIGSSWVDFSSETTLTAFPPIMDESLAAYNNQLLLVGGRLNNNQVKDDTLRWSKSDGLFWTKADSLTMIPKILHYTPRYGQSVVTDNAYRIWIIGGYDAGGNVLKDIWVGRLNSLGFGLPPM